MCGIAGIVDSKLGPNHLTTTLKGMCDQMIHRGPNSEGIIEYNPCALGMRRLSIIDLSTGDQPLYNDDKSIAVVANGEIYNDRELRKDLGPIADNIKSGSDIATIPYLYEKYGLDFVSHLTGMFAIAIWDRNKNRLVIARDRLGQKPLYFFQDGTRFAFASELKALSKAFVSPPEVNWEAIGQYFIYNRVPSPLCAMKGIQKLSPAHILVLEEDKITTQRYWHPSFKEKFQKTESEYIEELDALLSESVKTRMRSDVPLGAFLSGGVDSSLVVALMTKYTDIPVKTFCIGYHDDQFSEISFADKVAKHLGTDHRNEIIEPDNPEIIDELVSYFGEPFSDAFIPTYYVSKLAKQHVTVALTGDGGDENFAGYEWFIAAQYALKYQKLPSSIRKLIHATTRLLPHLEGKNRLPQLVRRVKNFSSRLRNDFEHPAFLFQAMMGDTSNELEHILLDKMYKLVDPVKGILSRKKIMDQYDGDNTVESIMYGQLFSLLPDNYFTKVDRMSMSVSLEARSPLIDHKLVEYVARIPFSYKVRNGESKYILKKVSEKYLPKEVLYRQKMGFSIPITNWIKTGKYREYFYDTFNSAAFRERSIYKPKEVLKLMDQHCAGKANHWARLWNILCLEKWFNNYID